MPRIKENPDIQASLRVVPMDNGKQALIVNRRTGQTVDIVRINDENDNPLWAVDKGGRGRFKARTTLVIGDFTLSGGWGSTASLALFGQDSDDHVRANITSGGTGIAANPTVVFTFKEGAWAVVPHGVVSRGDTAAPDAGDWRITAITTTAITLTFVGTPVSGNTYTFDLWVFG